MQSLGGAHRGRMCVCAFIWVSVCAYVWVSLIVQIKDMAGALLGDSLLLRGFRPWPLGADAAGGDLGENLCTPEQRLHVVVTVPSSSRRAAAVGGAGPCPRSCGWRGGGERVVRHSGLFIGPQRHIWGDLRP
jgi:hypothetical protein